MDIIANVPLNLHSLAILTNHLCFQRNRSAAVLATTLTILAFKNKKPIRKFSLLKWTKFDVKLRNFQYYGLILVSYKKCVAMIVV